MNLTLEDLGLAYRKAKVDLYYSSHASLLAIADYESHLLDNLQSLLDRLNGKDKSWIEDAKFLGSWTLAPKSIAWDDRKRFREEHGNGLIFSSPAEEWEHSCTLLADSDDFKKPAAEFRLMAQASLDFHVVSALWMLKVGHLYDAKLTGCAYGNRLRRKQNKEVNSLSLGSFSPYLKPFRDWRDKGIEAMRTALAADKKIVALTADVSAFYHELNPGFMLNTRFNQLLELELSVDQQKLHRLFIRSLQAWAQKTPLKKGLPVGLPASAVVANVALIELDRMMEQQVVPLYYGRYVDDIILVMENGANFRSTSELWQWLFDRSGGKLNWAKKEKSRQIEFLPEYLKTGKGKSQIRFANSKNKVFMLAGETGKTLVDSIARQIHERASEWRGMPRLPRLASHVGTDLVAATQSDGEAADNLRKADALTMRRAGFAIKLRDFEAYERDLPPDAWKDHRHAFFRAFTQHVLVLPYFFELAIYLPRVVRLATSCEDFGHLRKIIDSLGRICKMVGEQCTVSIKSCMTDNSPMPLVVIERWSNQVFETVVEGIIAAFPTRLSKAGKSAWQAHMEGFQPKFGLPWPKSIEEFQLQQARLFSHDLAHMPFRFIGFPKEIIAQRGIPAKKTLIKLKRADQLLTPKILKGITTLTKWLNLGKDLPLGLLFATRPFNLAELFILAKDPLEKSTQSPLKAVILALRGFALTNKTPHFDNKGVLQISDGKAQPKYTIAVSSWQTGHDSWVASATRLPDPDFERYARLNRLIDSVISQPKGASYLILPELAMPARWFARTAQKLQGRRISLITGIEYLHSRKARHVHNQVWAALSHDGLGFPSMMIYRQDKQQPALHEGQELQRLANLEMKPNKVWETPPVIQHGDFRFALLVCSELTNIGYRAALRGEVDALFVPEWNPDTETFNSLVESAALDIHAYIIQCNDRQYGDSRIRAPSKDSWRRDVLRVKGGIDDYCVSGTIDIHALREFQSSHRSPQGPFKPTPDGFKMSARRKRLPTSTG